jgi:hypothetical protein
VSYDNISGKVGIKEGSENDIMAINLEKPLYDFQKALSSIKYEIINYA